MDANCVPGCLRFHNDLETGLPVRGFVALPGTLLVVRMMSGIFGVMGDQRSPRRSDFHPGSDRKRERYAPQNRELTG
jgi:hypothetical protein